MGFKRAQPAVSVTALQEVPPVATILHMEVHMHSDDQRLSNKPHCRHLVRRCHRSLSSGSRRQAAAHITFSGSSSSPSSLSHCSKSATMQFQALRRCRCQRHFLWFEVFGRHIHASGVQLCRASPASLHNILRHVCYNLTIFAILQLYLNIILREHIDCRPFFSSPASTWASTLWNAPSPTTLPMKFACKNSHDFGTSA